MSRFLIFIAFLIASAFGGIAAAEAGPRVLPVLSGYFLDGRETSIPADLTGAATLLVFSPEETETQDAETWRNVAAQIDDEMATIFVVMMGNRRGMDRAMAAGRVRAQIRDPEIRASTVPIFGDGRDLRAGLGLGPGVSALVVNGAGEVIWQASGAASDATPDILENLLTRAPETSPLLVEPVEEARPAQTPVTTERSAPPSVPQAATIPAAPDALVSNEFPKLPAYKGITLDGRTLRLPGDLSPEGTRLVLVPEWEGVDALRKALVRMEEKSAQDGDDWFVLVFKGKAPQLGKAFAAGRLRAEISSAASRRHVIPLYMSISDFEASFGFDTPAALRVVTVTRDGVMASVGCLGEDC